MKDVCDRKTRKLTDAELTQRLRECPWCNGKIVQRERIRTDSSSGKRKFAGSFFGCSNFSKTGCGYWVNLDGVEKIR